MPPSLSSDTPPSNVKKRVWFNTSTSEERMRLRARWKKQRPCCLPKSEGWPQSLGEHNPRSEQTCAQTFGSGSTSKSDRLPSVVVLDHSWMRCSSSPSDEVKRLPACCMALWRRRVQR